MAAVLSKLEEFEIPYDEIYFGKPWADLYVDDRAWNQYTNPAFSQFMFNHSLNKMHLPKNCSNNENTLYKNNRTLVKKGPTSSLEGEVYFYKKITGTAIESMFPRYQSSNHSLDKSTLEMEFIEGNTVSKLFLNKLLTKPMLSSICAALARMHETQIEDTPVSEADIMVNYMGKLEERVKTHPNYSLPGIHEVVKTIKDSIKCTRIAHIVHGDPWFDNMMLTSNQEIKFLDMKGKIGSVLSIKGDTMVDYAKLYQSILGFDYLLVGGSYDAAYESLCRQWLGALLPFPMDDPVFEAVTACCILKTFFYFSKTEPILPIYKTLGKMRLFSQIV
jgi:aminoglycoside phosphotransferase